MAHFAVYVVPRSKKPGPDGRYNALPRLRITAAPVEGAANKQAERVLRDLIGANVRLIAGASSRRKIFDTDLPDAPLQRKLRDIFG